MAAGCTWGRKTHRALFLSDVHLGTRSCQAEELLDFLACNDAETLYLVGDIIDFWCLDRRSHWPVSHNDVLHTLLGKAHAGTRIVLLPGNHDEALKGYCGARFGRVELARTAVHRTADGRALLVTHGDEFDPAARYGRRLAPIGDTAHAAARRLGQGLERMSRRLGLGTLSLPGYVKRKVKLAVNYIGEFEAALAGEAERVGACGVVCGHVHHAAIRQIGRVLYVNTGDWVESATAVAEDFDGRLAILDWRRVMASRTAEPTPAARLRAAA